MSAPSRYRVLIPSQVAADMLEVLRGYEQIEIEAPGEISQAELSLLLPAADAVIIRSNNRITRELLESSPRLRVVGRAGAGLDNVDVEAATRRGVVVMNTPGANSISAAEHTLAMMLALARRIPAADRSVKAGLWERGRFQGAELTGKTLGVIGLGRIGSLVAKRAQALGMKVIAHDPFVGTDQVRDTSIELVGLEDLYRAADFITVHAPLTPKTHHLVDAAAFEVMRAGVRIVNCARGGIVDEEALCDAIEAGKVAGAALDVFEKEPPAGSRVTRCEDIVLTPHLGGSTAEAQTQVGVAIARQVAEFLTRGIVQNAANTWPLTGETLARVGPYLDVCERMASMAAQLLDGAPQRLLLTFHGERFQGDVEMLAASALKGLLSVALEGSGVNFVNARALARERGLEVVVAHGGEREDFSNLIVLRLESEQDAHEVAGTQFGKRDSRIVGIDGFPLEVKPQGWVLVTLSENYPGIIGRMGSIIGRHGGNINKMNNGCASDGARSLSTMSLDAEPPREMLEDLAREPYFHRIRLVHL